MPRAGSARSACFIQCSCTPSPITAVGDMPAWRMCSQIRRQAACGVRSWSMSCAIGLLLATLPPRPGVISIPGTPITSPGTNVNRAPAEHSAAFPGPLADSGVRRFFMLLFRFVLNVFLCNVTQQIHLSHSSQSRNIVYYRCICEVHTRLMTWWKSFCTSYTQTCHACHSLIVFSERLRT